MTGLACAPPAHAVSFGQIYTPLPPDSWWRCVVLDHGYGRVTGTRHFAGAVSGYSVALDGGGLVQVLRNRVRRLPMLRVVQAAERPA